MIYITANLDNNKGNHGHQLKDVFAVINTAKILDFKYVHTMCEYLDFFGLGFGEISVLDLPSDIKTVTIEGSTDHKITQKERIGFIEKVMEILFEIKKTQKNDCLVVINCRSQRGRLCSPCGKSKFGIKSNENIFNKIVFETTEKFKKKHSNRKVYFDNKKISVAMHISRGQDYDKDKYPKHFSYHEECRYMFPMHYYVNIIKNLENVIDKKSYELHIYTEKLNSEEIMDAFRGKKNVIIHMGDNRDQKNYDQIYDIFYHFVQSDILITCNSSFSTVANYFRYDKPTIYHPHFAFSDISSCDHIPTDEEGNFNIELLRSFIYDCKNKI